MKTSDIRASPLPDAGLADLLEYHEESYNEDGAQHVGGEVWKRDDALVIFSHPELGTGLNFACRIRSEESAVEKLVDEASEWLTRRGSSPHFRISPLTRPPTLTRVLRPRGFCCTETETQMVLAGEDTEAPANPRVTIEQVETQALDNWVELQNRGFGMTVSSPIFVELARNAVHVSDSHPYLARLDGEAAGAGMLTHWAGVFGIYGVATLPEKRSKGVGTALVRQMIRDVRARGGAPLCLQAETGGKSQHWYGRLGFRVVYDRTGWTLKAK